MTRCHGSRGLEEGREPAVRKTGGRVFQTEGTATAKARRQEASVAGVEGVRGEKQLEAKEGMGGTGQTLFSPGAAARYSTQRSQ